MIDHEGHCGIVGSYNIRCVVGGGGGMENSEYNDSYNYSYYDYYDDATPPATLSLIWTIPISLLIISTAMANCLIIITWIQNTSLHTPPNLHIVSLAVADMLVAVTTMPITLLQMTGHTE